MKIISLIFISLFTIPGVIAQTISLGEHNVDLEKAKTLKSQLKEQFRQKPFKMNGGISLNSVYTLNDGKTIAGTNPLTYMANGNLRLSIYNKLTIPVTFTYSNRKFSYSYTTPNVRINRLSLHPHYKEWTAHIGDAGMSFSPYTLSGVQFTGTGLEYAPNKVKIQALYGRFLKAVPEDSTGRKPAYKRMGWGVKAAYQHNGKKLGLALFHAKDDLYSITIPSKSTNTDIRPMEGTALALEMAWPLMKKLQVETALSTSVLTRDLLSGGKEVEKKEILNNLVGTNNTSTAIYHAIKAGLNYSFSKSSVGVNYERVDPNYQTLGGYYFTNDLENVTLQLTQTLLKDKVNITLNGGVQKDDLAHTKQSRMKRVVLSSNLAWRPNARMSITANHSSFQSYTFIQPALAQITQTDPYENIDTLDFTQLSQNAGINLTYLLPKQKQQQQSFGLNLSYMESANRKGATQTVYNGELTRFITGNANHSISLTEKNFTVATGFMYSWSYGAMRSMATLGPSLNITKTFFKKRLRITSGGMYNTVKGHELTSEVLNLRSNAAITIKKKHNLTTAIQWQQRVANTKTSQLLTINTGYSCSF